MYGGWGINGREEGSKIMENGEKKRKEEGEKRENAGKMGREEQKMNGMKGKRTS